jgi:hypothetical protein
MRIAKTTMQMPVIRSTLMPDAFVFTAWSPTMPVTIMIAP